MILTVTLNPCIDKTIYLSEPFAAHSRNISQSSRSEIGGKGINVSTVLSHFQMDTFCTGYNCKEDARILTRALEERGIPYRFVETAGNLRTNIKIFDPSNHAMTELNERGASIEADAHLAFLSLLEELLPQASLLVLSGSLPPGLPADTYQNMISLAHRHNVRTILDASGEPLRLGLDAHPFLIKPNLDEFRQIFEEELVLGVSALTICRRLIREGISCICLSLGHAGALFLDSQHIYYAKALPIKALGMTGAGDSMVAGICYALCKEPAQACRESDQQVPDSKEMLRCAMAAAAASVQLPGTQLASLEDFEVLLPQVEIMEL